MRFRLLIMLGCVLMCTRLFAENANTVSVIFKNFPKGASYAENESHDLGNGLVIYTTLCHFTEELRIYSSKSYNGYVVSDPLPGVITSMSFNMGYQKDILNVYGSTDKENWVLVKGIETTSTSYKNYTLQFPVDSEYTCFKLDVKGDQQIRIASMSITYLTNENGGSEGDEEEGEDDAISVSAPTFNPGTSTFDTESIDVVIGVAEGCEAYYTTDGSVPSYTDASNYQGIKGTVATVQASESPVTLKAIAVDLSTGTCSEVSSATYTYKAPSVPDEELSFDGDGSMKSPYTVSDIKKMSTLSRGNVWVKGTIYGTVRNGMGNVATSNFVHSENIVIGDATACVPIRLVYSEVRDLINLKDFPYLKGKEILIKGDLTKYQEVLGLELPTRYTITYDVPINSYGYASLFLDMSVSVPEGSMAYYCTVSGDIVRLQPVGNIVPDSTGVVISSTPNSICTLTYTTESNNDEETILAENQLIGFSEETTVTANGNAYYALNAKNGQLGFYIPQTIMDGGFVAKAHKAYLQVPEEAKASVFFLYRESEVTKIDTIVEIPEDATFDLQGRIVTCPTQGVYIRGGKKIVIR